MIKSCKERLVMIIVLFLIIVGIVILFCVLGQKLSYHLGLPALLLFIGVGMLFGSDGILQIPFNDFALAEKICTVALIFIMFYGGFGTNWQAAKPVAAPSILLSTVGVLLTAGLTGCLLYTSRIDIPVPFWGRFFLFF